MKNVSLISLQGRGVFKGELRGLEHPSRKDLMVKSGKNCENRGSSCEKRENRILSTP